MLCKEYVLELNSVNSIFKINVPLKRICLIGFSENTVLVLTNT